MLEDLLPPDEDYTTLFPRGFIMKGFACTNNCGITGPIELRMYNNPETEQFEFIFTSTMYRGELVADKYLNTKSSETFLFKKLEELIKKAGHDKRIYFRENNGKVSDSIVLTHFLGEKEKKKKRFSCDRNTFPSDAVLIMFQALLLKGKRKNFLFDIISLEDALKVRVKITYYFTDNVLSLSKNFPFPQGIIKAVRPEKKYHVFEMRIHGLLSLFVWSSWFFVYKAGHPYGFVVYWGGYGKNAEVFYFLESKIEYDQN